jgi:hypothetical protein
MGKKKAAATREVSDGELEGEVRALVQRASGLSNTEMKKELGDEYKKLDKRALETARALASRGLIYRIGIGKKERFFAADPFDRFDKTVTAVLAGGPLDDAELKRRLESEARGFGDLLTKKWLDGALARGAIFPHPAQGSKKKRFGLQPDVTSAFKSVFTALRKALDNDRSGIPRETLLAALARELGLSLPAQRAETTIPTGSTAATPAPASVRDSFIRALRELAAENVANGLLPIRDLRARLRLDKQSFDRLSLELSRDGVVTLHHHDFPTSLSPAQREDMVEDERGTHYVGIALRRSHG